MPSSDLRVARALAEAVAAAGGTAYFVGGYVRDRLLNLENKDIDIEIHGIHTESLEAILSQLGEMTVMGKSFGIYGLKHTGLDIAMPRQETAIGRGHRDFRVIVDPFLGTTQACRRRDFTVNSMLQNILTGEIIDPFNGISDLHRGILRHVDQASFMEDPLRALRAAQFSARFGFQVADETIALSSNMSLTDLPRERIAVELNKALLKSSQPSVFFQVLRRMNQLSDWFCELTPLIGLNQEPKFHPEGDVWNHTMLVLDAGAGLRSRASDPLGLMLSCLTHDFGKATTTETIDGRIRSIGHEIAGREFAGQFIARIYGNKKLRRYVSNMTELHMRPNILAGQNASQKAFSKLYDLSVCPEDLLLLAQADRMGQPIELDYTETSAYLHMRLNNYHEIMSKPFVTGIDLIRHGIEPGPAYSAALSFAHKLRLSNVPKDTALKQTLGFLRSEYGNDTDKR